MTLEKLLIFGFGLAVVIALTFTATNISKERKPTYDSYSGKVKALVDATK